MTSHLLVLLILLATNSDTHCQPCDDYVERNVGSSLEFTSMFLEVQHSPLVSQTSCYYILLSSGTLDLSLSQTFNVSSNVVLEGRDTVVKCNFTSFDHQGIISVSNVQYFGIRSVTVTSCPTTFVRFENVSSVAISASSFRYVKLH